MPTSVNVTNLKINELKESQYDTAVQQGVIGENELSILTDVEVGQVIQVATLPTAGADELGNIYQFVGTTDANYTHGYFYECVSDGQQPATYSWSNIQVQASSGSSYTAGTGIDITNGTISVTSPTLTNRAVGSRSIIIGEGTSVSGIYTTVLGTNAVGANFGVSIGDSAANTSGGAIAIGYAAKTNAACIQLNTSVAAATNSDAGTFKVANSNGNYEIMSADGTIPTARLTKVNSTVTIAVADWNGGTTVTKTVAGITATGVVMVAPDPTDQADYTSAGIMCTAQAADSLTFTATTTPSADIDVNVVML